MTWLSRLLPPTGLARSLSLQSALFAVGEGVFLTGNAVFFTQVVGLRATQVGLGLSISGGAALLLSVPLGRLVDRFEPRTVWAVGSLVRAALFLCYPLVHGFGAFIAILVVLAGVDAFADAGRGAYTIGVFAREERVRSMAFMRSALNVGFTVGAALGGIALATGSLTVVRSVPVLTAVVLVLNGVLVLRLPRLARASRPAQTTAVDQAVGGRSALQNRGFLVLSLCNGVLQSNQVLLNTVVPLWLVERTDAPRVLLAWLFGTNTVLAVLLQVRAARGAETVSGALRAVRRCAACFVLSCAVIAVTHDTIGWVSIVLIWAGHVTITGAELWQSAAAWGFTAELSDPERRGDYQGVWRLGSQLEIVVGPALFTFLALGWGAPGWAVIAVLAVVAGVVAHPAARRAERHLQGVTGSTAAVPRMSP